MKKQICYFFNLLLFLEIQFHTSNLIKRHLKTKYKKIFTPKLFNYKNWMICKICNNDCQFSLNFKFANFYVNRN